MEKIENIINEYLDNSYVFVDWLDEKHNVRLVKSKIDDQIYVCKFKDYYNIDIYNKLKDIHIQGIPKVEELMETEGGLIIIEEYIDGVRLDEFSVSNVLDNKAIEKRICEIGIEICEILGELHSMKPPVIHRDVKPQNIILSKGKIYLIDFNIAKAFSGEKSKDTFIMGTRDYAAPEQYGFSESDLRTDIYGLGATIRFLIEKENVRSEKLQKIIKKSMEIDPEKRYQNTNEMIRALSSIDSKESKTIKNFRIPGFRSGNIIYMLISSVFYLIWGYICLTLDMTNSPYDGIEKTIYNWISRLFMVVVSCFFVATTFNYLGIQDKIFKGLNIYKPNLLKRILIIAVIDVLVFAILFFLSLIIIMLVIGNE